MLSPATIAETAGPTLTAPVEELTYGEFAIRVGASLDALGWLVEFICPPFGTGGDGAGAATVTLRDDGRLYEQALAQRPMTDAPELDSFANDGHMIRLPAWTAAPHTIAAMQESFRVVYLVDESTRSVAILSRENNRRARTALMRVVRELAMNNSRCEGGLLLHAAALALGDRGVLIPGEKGAGKTSLLLYLLRETGAAYVSNDRVLLPAAMAGGVRGMPTIVTVRQGTVALFSDLQSTVQQWSYDYRRALAETLTDRQPAQPNPPGSYHFSPAQLCALMGAARRAECAPRALFFPRVVSGLHAGRLRDLAADEAAARLRRAWLSAGLSKKTSDLFSFSHCIPPPEEHLEEMSRTFAARVPCFECQLGSRAYEDGTLAAECVRALG
jgi:hypothetical protein